MENIYKLEEQMEDATEEERMNKVMEYFPNFKLKTCRMGEGKRGENKYKVTISNQDQKYNTTFTDSLYNTYNNTKSSNFEILYCIISDAISYYYSRTLEDFIDEFGYEDEKQAKRIYDGCRRSYEGLSNLFGEDSIEVFNAITYNY